MPELENEKELTEALKSVANLGFVLGKLAQNIEDLNNTLKKDIALRQANPPR
jgi:hypothetical protein